MTKIILSHEDYERVLREGLDLDAYLQGRFDEAASDVKYLNEEVDVTIPISLDGERLGEALVQANLQEEADAAKSHALYAQYTADRALNSTTELAARIEALEHPEPLKETGSVAYPAKSLTCESGRTYAVRDAMVFPDRGDVAIIFEVEDSPNDTLPVNVFWEKSKCCEWMADAEFENAFKIN
ncbi:hypothetical protein ACTND8_02840 [Atopobiaceae bacterium HCP3S3_F7]|uniref:hypothetical protein n=1 Tax=Coriobacteriia TaxID=84998 RepID=UPI003F8BCF84